MLFKIPILCYLCPSRPISHAVIHTDVAQTVVESPFDYPKLRSSSQYSILDSLPTSPLGSNICINSLFTKYKILVEKPEGKNHL